MSSGKKPLLSMTGYGRANGSFEDWSWVWEVRAGNSKNLDIRLRLPSGFESLDPLIRKKILACLARGNLQTSLVMQSQTDRGSYRINNELLSTLVETAAEFTGDGKISTARIDGLMRIKGVVVEGEKSASDPKFKARNEALLDSLDAMIDSLIKARMAEGVDLAAVLSGSIDEFETLCARAKTCDGARMERIKAGFEQKLGKLLGDNLPEDRMAQEMAILAVKADVREELDRLDAHVKQAKILLAAGSPVGRKLDFLAQEFIREINTLCAKSGDIDLTQIGLEMKSLVEQFREQSANVE